MTDADRTAGHLSRLPEGLKPFAATVTGNTLFGVPAVVATIVPAGSRAEAERTLREAMATGRATPLLGDAQPEMDVRLTVFELSLPALAHFLRANGYRVDDPPARAGHPADG